MLKTSLCDRLGIELPIILAPMGSCTSAGFAAAMCNEGGLGCIGSLFRPAAAVKRDIDMIRTLTKRPFAINHIPHMLDSELFQYTLDARPAAISFALADPGDLIRRVHDIGSLAMMQITTVEQANRTATRVFARGGAISRRD
jgi:enoyl-[acyl-carrier protein] reductase II